MQDQDTDTTAATSALPFSPITDTGLGIHIEEHSSTWVHMVTTGRIFDPRLSVESRLITDMCRARVDRILGHIQRRQGAAA